MTRALTKRKVWEHFITQSRLSWDREEGTHLFHSKRGPVHFSCLCWSLVSKAGSLSPHHRSEFTHHSASSLHQNLDRAETLRSCSLSLSLITKSCVEVFTNNCLLIYSLIQPRNESRSQRHWQDPEPEIGENKYTQTWTEILIRCIFSINYTIAAEVWTPARARPQQGRPGVK